MTQRANNQSAQSGAALVIVLLLVATMSFVALAISERTVLSARRSVNARARSELLWFAAGAEALARAAIKTTVKESQGKMTPETPLFAAPMEMPIEGGGAVMVFADRSRCFNLNALVAGGEDENGGTASEAAREEFKVLMDAAQTPDAEAVTAAIVDWIDADSLQEPRGAEDSHYAGLPTPYRTGGQPLADVSEIRAVAGVGREHYQKLARFVCAHPIHEPAGINVNMLEAEDAPLIAGLTGGQISANEAVDVIRASPPGGYENVEAFWAAGALAGVEVGPDVQARAKLTSEFIEAYAVINYGEATANLSMIFDVGESGAPRLVSRRLERFD